MNEESKVAPTGEAQREPADSFAGTDPVLDFLQRAAGTQLREIRLERERAAAKENLTLILARELSTWEYTGI